MEPTAEGIETLTTGKVELVDFKPETPKTDVPVLFVPGWNESPELLAGSIKSLVEEGRRVLAIDFHGYSKDKNDFTKPTIQLDRAEAILAALADKGVEQTDVFTHSGGSIPAIYAATIATEGTFRNVILDKAAGSIGRDNLFRLSGRFIRSLLNDYKSIGSAKLRRSKDAEDTAKTLRLGRKRFQEHPRSGLQEALALVKGSEIFDFFKELREEKGVKIAIIAGVDDLVFPMEKQQTFVEAGIIDGFLSVKEGHQETSGVVIDRLLTALEAKPSVKSSTSL